MALYLLDKNVVEDIKQSLKGAETPGAALARSIDRKGNAASPLLAVLEGSKRRAQTAPEFHDQLIADTQAVSLFYRHAKTDATYLKAFSATATTILAPYVQEKTGALILLALQLQALVVRQRKWEDAREVLRKIDAFAHEHKVNASHPLVTCAVSCLFGNKHARGVLKPAVNPTEQGAYNAVTDIRLIIETANIRNMSTELGSRKSVRLHSSDQALNAFDKQLQLQAFRSVTDPEIITFGLDRNDDLLPNLKEQSKERDRVFDYLRLSRDGDRSILT